jgi:hypothetical protein
VFIFHGDYENQELGLMSILFDAIVRESWFHPSSDAKADFARFLTESFPHNSYDADQHRTFIETSARLFYSAEEPRLAELSSYEFAWN